MMSAALSVTLAAMFALPAPNTAFGAVDPAAAAAEIVAPKTSRLPSIAASATDRACAGQAWGGEELDCILAITRDSGLQRTVRLASAGGSR